MFAELPELHDYEKILLYDKKMNIDDMDIEIIKTSHDVSDSRSFIITSDKKSMVYLTDTGYINQKNFEFLKDKNIYLFESNHDIEMLINGPYPKYLKDRVDKEGSLSHYNNINVLFMYALIGAYKQEGHEWLDELKQVLSENMNYATQFIKEHFKGVTFSPSEGTYMLFVDCTEWCKEHNKETAVLPRTEGISSSWLKEQIKSM